MHQPASSCLQRFVPTHTSCYDSYSATLLDTQLLRYWLTLGLRPIHHVNEKGPRTALSWTELKLSLHFAWNNLPLFPSSTTHVRRLEQSPKYWTAFRNCQQPVDLKCQVHVWKTPDNVLTTTRPCSGDNDLQASEAEASVFRFYVFSAYCKISKVHLDARHAI